MIPRTLVPVKVRPLNKDEAQKPPQRVTTDMDSRTVVPSRLSHAPPLSGKSSIPAHLPLGVLVTRTLVPRGMEVKPLEKIEQVSTFPVDILDSRIVVPADIKPLTPEEALEVEHAPELTAELREVVEPDIFITGDANLLMEQKEKRDPRWDAMTRVLSVLVHVAVIAFLIFSPKIFRGHVPTQADIDLAKRQLQWIYTPPELPATPPSPAPKIQITPKTLSKVAPPIVEPPAPAPAPQSAPELPEAPAPRSSVAQAAPAQPPAPAPSHLEALQSPVTPGRLHLGLSQMSPGREIQDQLQDAIRRGRTQGGIYGGGPVAPGAGGPGMAQGYQILSDTQGVDFSSYIQRLLATLRRNWYAVMPESAQMGDRGIVFTTFQINPDGSVPSPDPLLERSSGKDPLDNAAMSAIHASNPFEPLPSAFHGPYLRLRIIFIYNIPPDQVNIR